MDKIDTDYSESFKEKFGWVLTTDPDEVINLSPVARMIEMISKRPEGCTTRGWFGWK